MAAKNHTNNMKVKKTKSNTNILVDQTHPKSLRDKTTRESNDRAKNTKVFSKLLRMLLL